MLALKKVLTEADSVPTLIFDEIDQGIGGRVGMTVGEKLWQLARSHQVFCVTHLPQLAAFGDQHIRVLKLVDGGRTTTALKLVERFQPAMNWRKCWSGTVPPTVRQPRKPWRWHASVPWN